MVLVGGGPGDPGLLTLRGRAALAEADVVVADRLAPLALLDELPAEVTVVDAAKVPGGRSMPQEEIDRLLVEHARAGRVVVRLKGGDPFVFGRGMEEVEACVAAGVAVEVVPGVTSAIAVPGAAGIPVTHRGVVQAFTVVSGHVAAGRPRVDRRLEGAGGGRRHAGRPHGRAHDPADRGRAARRGPARAHARSPGCRTVGPAARGTLAGVASGSDLPDVGVTGGVRGRRGRRGAGSVTGAAVWATGPRPFRLVA